MKFISTVFQIYQRFLIYIGGFQNISAILNLYRRFFKYIDLPTKSITQKTHSLESVSSPITYFPKIEEAALILVLNSFRLYVVRIQSCSHQILEDFLDYTSATRPFLLHYTPYTPLHRQLRFTIISGYIGCHLCNFRITN